MIDSLLFLLKKFCLVNDVANYCAHASKPLTTGTDGAVCCLLLQIALKYIKTLEATSSLPLVAISEQRTSTGKLSETNSHVKLQLS